MSHSSHTPNHLTLSPVVFFYGAYIVHVTSSSASWLPIGFPSAGVAQRPPDVVYSDLARSTAGEPIPPPPRTTSLSEPSASAAATKYAVLDFHEGKQSSAALAQQEESRNDVYGNAASILTSVVVPRSAVDINDRIDGGQFGDVFRGLLHRNGESIPVAIKAVRMDLTDNTAMASFLEETSTMAQLRHQNVVQLLAVVQEPLLLVMELISEGTVLAYVRAHPGVPLPVLLHIANNCAQGLKYLHDHKVIHRDVAARCGHIFFL